MGTVESGAGTEVFVDDLDETLPDGSDVKSWGDNNLRFLKEVFKNSLPVSFPVGGYAAAGGTANALTVSIDTNVAITATEGMEVYAKAASENTGATTLEITGVMAITAKTVKRVDGDDLKSGDIQPGMICHFRYDGSYWQLLNPWKNESEAIQNQSYIHATDSGSANAYVVTLTPIPDALTAGMRVSFLAGNDNSGASTLKVNSFSAVSIKMPDGSDLAAGDIQAGGIAECVYDGTNFQLVSMSTISRGASPDTQVKITSSDTTKGYLSDKVVGGQVENSGGNETLSLDSRIFFFSGF